jgi:hypothetical protein
MFMGDDVISHEAKIMGNGIFTIPPHVSDNLLLWY